MNFRAGLLDGRRFALAGTTAGSQLRVALSALGAWTESIDDAVTAGEDQAAAWVTARRPLHALVHDTAPDFNQGGQNGLRVALERAFISARAVAAQALIPAGAGRLLFLAPRPQDGPMAEAARAGLENLARTLSVEWARHTVTAVTLCPGPGTTDEQLAGIAAFLLSEAGGYFTGCRFDLGSEPGRFISAS